ncbi:hypothetical protein X956_09260 [Trueperella pyogenes TP8]|uniref:hypothetical protein n=1 Tax=Trueperella pyogenes TaxID=1661 RepID=UPI00057F11CE|nr:hypothetical protein [Trueperella pyogenes]AJC70158.1 hypothetical protein X956_09260 [Trueperella pyogenes TP8]MBB3025499.1 hypothetical protein [Trueperella pyogenes]SUO88019.1 Uncharacterised protein [Trueperella pyogenes]
MTTPRRPAQLKPEQIELIEGDADTAATSELAHTSAQAIVPLGNTRAEESGVSARVLELIREEGIDMIAESWVNSPDDSLPGVLWRGFLLSEWIRRYPEEVAERFAAARVAMGESEPEKLEQVLNPREVRAKWDEVFVGGFVGDFADVLRASARLTDFLGRVQPTWISSDKHPMATEVTRRDTAMLRTADEFRVAGERLVKGLLG